MVYYHFGLSLNNLSNRLTVLLAYIASIFSFTMPFLILFVLKPSVNASFIVWQVQSAKDESQNRAATSGITSIILTGLVSKRFNCPDQFNLTATGYPQPAKCKSTSFWSWLPANGWELMNAVSKSRLRLLWLVRLYKPLLLPGFNAPRAGNGQRSFVELVDIRGWGLSNKNYLNVLKGKGPKR